MCHPRTAHSISFLLSVSACSAPVHDLEPNPKIDVLYVSSLEAIPYGTGRRFGGARIDAIEARAPSNVRTVWTGNNHNASPDEAPDAFDLSADGRRLFLGKGEVLGVELATGLEQQAPLITDEPINFVYAPRGDPQRLYVGSTDLTSIDLGPEGGLIGATLRRIDLVSSPDGGSVTALASNDDGSKLYAAVWRSGVTSVRSMSRDGLAGSDTPIDFGPSCVPSETVRSMALTPDHQLVLWLWGCVIVWDPASKATLFTAHVDSGTGFAYDRTHHRAYVISGIKRELAEIDLSSGATTNHFGFSALPIVVAVTPEGDRVFVVTTTTDGRSDQIDILDTDTGEWIRDAVHFDSPRNILPEGLLVGSTG